MNFTSPLVEGVLLKRYKRFLTDVQLLDGSIVHAHCTNTGSMKEVLDPPQRAWLCPATNPARKLPYTLYALEREGAMIGVHTHLTNDLVAEALEKKHLAPLAHITDWRREVALPSGSRLDFCGKEGDRPYFVEVKHVSLAYGSHGYFPDSVTVRGLKHLEELLTLHGQGVGVAMLYVTQRSDITAFSPAEDIDPAYAAMLRKVRDAGVAVYAYNSLITPEEITIADSITIVL